MACSCRLVANTNQKPITSGLFIWGARDTIRKKVSLFGSEWNKAIPSNRLSSSPTTRRTALAFNSYRAGCRRRWKSIIAPKRVRFA